MKPNEETASSTSAMTPEADKIASLAELIIKKVESGSIDDLKAVGMKVSNMSGGKQQIATADKPPFDETDEDLDTELINRLMQDDIINVRTETVGNIEQQPWFATVENYRQQLLSSSSNSDIARKALSQTAEVKMDIVKEVYAANELLAGFNNQFSSFTGGGGEAPEFVEIFEQKSTSPSISSRATAIVGETMDDLVEFGDDSEESDGNELSQLADQIQTAALTEASSTKTKSLDLNNINDGDKSGEDDMQREVNAATFAELLKASLEDNNEKMTEEELASLVTDDANAGKSLDLRSFVGGTLFSIAEAMQINLTEEIQSSSEIQAELTKLLQGNTKELDKNMLNIDEQSAKLMEQLNTMQLELLEEEKVFEASKQDEFDKLFSKQTSAQSDLMKARENFELKAMRLQELMKGINENADLLTYFAMFPLKPDDQKLIFVMGLSMTLKTMFDLFIANMMQLPDLALDMTEPSDISKVVIQSIIVAVAFNYTGVWKAIFNTFTGKTGLKGMDKSDIL